MSTSHATSRSPFVAILLFAAACGPQTPDPTIGTSEGSSPTETTAGPGTGPTTTTTTTPGTSSSSSTPSTTIPTTGTTDPGTTEETCGFVCGLDDEPQGVQCDPFLQDCPEGEKCQAYDSDGSGSWNALKCVPVRGDGALDDPCTANPITEGGDDCAKGYMCWNLDDELHGTCHGMCTGSPEDPGCADDCTQCLLTGDGVLTLCLPNCDPLEPNCSGETVCIGNPNGQGFVCVLDASGGNHPLGSPCEFANICNPGHFCASAEFFPYPGCEDALGCCATFCDLAQGQGDQNPTCQAIEGEVPGVECVSWYGEDPPPPGVCFTDGVGACGLP